MKMFIDIVLVSNFKQEKTGHNFVNSITLNYRLVKAESQNKTDYPFVNLKSYQKKL